MKQILLWYKMVNYCTLSVTLCDFGFALKLFSDNPSQNLRYVSNEWLNIRNSFIVSQCNDVYPGSIKKWYIAVDSFVALFIINFRYCKIPSYVHSTTHESCMYAIMHVCGWGEAISSELKCQRQEFPLCFQIFRILLAVHNLRNLEAWASVALLTIRSYHWQRTKPSSTYMCLVLVRWCISWCVFYWALLLALVV